MFRRIIRNLLLFCVSLFMSFYMLQIVKKIFEFCEMGWKTTISISIVLIIFAIFYAVEVFFVFKILPDRKYSNYIRKIKRKQEKRKEYQKQIHERWLLFILYEIAILTMELMGLDIQMFYLGYRFLLSLIFFNLLASLWWYLWIIRQNAKR